MLKPKRLMAEWNGMSAKLWCKVVYKYTYDMRVKATRQRSS